jgi:hypothetical protein
MKQGTTKLPKAVRKKLRGKYETALAHALVQWLAGALETEEVIPDTGDIHCYYEFRQADGALRVVMNGEHHNTEHVVSEIEVPIAELAEAMRQ